MKHLFDKYDLRGWALIHGKMLFGGRPLLENISAYFRNAVYHFSEVTSNFTNKMVFKLIFYT